jgi:hypothetical protein
MTSIFPGLLLAAIVWSLLRLRARNKRRFVALSPVQKKAERKRRAKARLWD